MCAGLRCYGCMAFNSRDIWLRRRYMKRLTIVCLVLLILQACASILRVGNVPRALITAIMNSCDGNFKKLEEFDEANVEKTRYSPLDRSVVKLVDTAQNMPICPSVPPNLVGLLDVNVTMLSAATKTTAEMLKGGQFSPKGCIARHKVAIIIPLRNRDLQLHVLLTHMHPIWQRQQIDYTVYVVSQAGQDLFNRAKLMNIGVSEAEKDRRFDCYVFHDTDLLVEDDRCLYWCDNKVARHLARHVDIFSYQPLKYAYECMPAYSPKILHGFGGVSMTTRKQFEKVNGFSNLYWGWGGEDDDMYLRLWSQGVNIDNPYGERCSFSMIKHDHESTNPENPGRQALLYHAMSRSEQDGFSTLRYRVLSIERTYLYTNITVDIGRPTEKMKEFMFKTPSWFARCATKMPWCP